MPGGYGHDAPDARHDFRCLGSARPLFELPLIASRQSKSSQEGTSVRSISRFAIAWLALPGQVMIVVTLVLAGAALFDPLKLAQQSAMAQPSAEAPQAGPKQDDSPEAKMSRRFPQKIRVGDLLGLPVLDGGDVTLGHVRKVVRTPAGRIKLIVSYSRWFGWDGRFVSVPIEVVAILGRQLASLDMVPADYEAAPTWVEAGDRDIPPDEIIRIAITRR
jgi:hypothetical protein